MDWIYGQIVGFLGNFFALMGNMGVELFELEWVSAIILFFSRLAWALFAVSVVVCAFECGIELAIRCWNCCAGLLLFGSMQEVTHSVDYERCALFPSLFPDEVRRCTW